MLDLSALFGYLLLVLSTYGLTFGLVRRDGAFATMKKIRDRVGESGWSPFHCFYCTGVWVALVFTLLAFISTGGFNFGRFVLLWWAVTAGSYILDWILGRPD